MRWGIRKDRRKSGSSSGKSKSKASITDNISSAVKTVKANSAKKKRVDALKKANKARAQQKKTDATTNNPKKMSEAELKKRIERLELEKKYTDLSRSQISKGQKMISDAAMDILGNSMKNIGTQTLTYLAGTMMNNLLGEYSKKYGDGARPINPRKGQKDK